LTLAELIKLYYPSAVAATAGSPILPQTLFTQLIMESGYNLSTLATKYYNFFGIKSTPNFTGKTVSISTYEYNGGKHLVVGTNKVYNSYSEALNQGANKITLFRVYTSATNGFKDYVNFLKTNPRYKKVLLAKTPEDQFNELQNAGYATSPTYADDLKNIYNSIKKNLPKIVATGASIILLFLVSLLLHKQFKK
jgi:flagellar protein FlgJ